MISARRGARIATGEGAAVFRRIDVGSADWERLDAFADRTVFQTREWLQFVAESQRGSPVLAELRANGSILGFFSGLTFTRLGVKVLGSSFPGWTTPYMGFNLNPGVSRQVALEALERFAWHELRCMHLEVSDPGFTVADGESGGFRIEYYASYRSDLTRSEETLFNGMESACRRCIRKAEKSGVTIEEAGDIGFADEYYEQLRDVFAKQSLVPTYPLERVRALVRNLLPRGNILLLRARDADGKCIATGIYPGYNQIAQFWGNASLRAYQRLRPNEACHWYAMRYWKRRGAVVFDWGGGGTYKEKYGCAPARVMRFSKSRYPVVGVLRDEARNLFARRQKVLGWLQGAAPASDGANGSCS